MKFMHTLQHCARWQYWGPIAGPVRLTSIPRSISKCTEGVRVCGQGTQIDIGRVIARRL